MSLLSTVKFIDYETDARGARGFVTPYSGASRASGCDRERGSFVRVRHHQANASGTTIAPLLEDALSEPHRELAGGETQ